MVMEELPDSVFDEIDPDILDEIGDPVAVPFAATVVYVPLLLLGLILSIFWQKTIRAEFAPLQDILNWTGLGVGTGLVLVGLTWAIGRFLPALRELEIEFQKVLGPLECRQIIWLALLSATAEECLFRGTLQPWIGYVPTSILFGLLHFVPIRVFLPWTAFAIVAGFVFGALFDHTGNLIAPIVAHALVNGLNLHLIVRGKRVPPGGNAEVEPATGTGS